MRAKPIAKDATSYERSRSGSRGHQTTMYHSVQQMLEQLSRREVLSSCKCSMPLDLGNARQCRHITEQAHTSSLLTAPDLNMPQLTTPEPEELVIGLNAPKTPPKPTTLFPFTEDQQHWSCFVDGLPELQLQQQEQTQQQPPPVLQQQVTSCPNVSDSSASTPNP
ncbi:hypothetical protein MTO96_035556 [Rhipicephalus appendiculatus]